MILEIDAGNTRVKWRLMSIKNGALVKGAEGFVLAGSNISIVCADLEKQIAQGLVYQGAKSKVQKVRVSSVRGEQFNVGFATWVEARWQLQPEFARVVKECGGVTNGYLDVSSMGVDRWLAMLAAYNDVRASCCIVDCGSAVTLDLVDDDGQHRGGYIVPGLGLMQEALLKKSSVLDSSEKLWGSTAPANNTGDAVRHGLLNMVLGMIEKVRNEYKGRENISWFVTGGDAGLVSPLVSWKHKVVPDLVMDGLAISLV